MYPKPLVLLSQAIQSFRIKSPQILPVVILPSLLNLTAGEIYFSLFHPDFSRPETTMASISHPGFWVFILVSLFFSLWSQSSLLYAVVHLRQEISPLDILKKSLAFIPRQFLLNFLTFISILVGLILLVVPGIILGVILSLSVYIMYSEDLSPTKSLTQSWHYLQGHLLEYLYRAAVLGLSSFAFIFFFSLLTSLIRQPTIDAIIDFTVNVTVSICSSIYFYLNYLYLKSLKLKQSN